jgi:hypothetical protein
MSFGRNPHVAKAEAAEQKALDAKDDDSRKRAYLEAAHLWDRAAEREKPGKKRDEYARKAEDLRALADGASPEEDEDGAIPSKGAPQPSVAKVLPFPRKP